MMKKKSYNELLEQYKRIMREKWDDKSGSLRYEFARRAFHRYAKNIALALGKKCARQPDYMAEFWINRNKDREREFPYEIYAHK